MSKYKVFIFYHNRDIEAHTIDPELANSFLQTRSKIYYTFKKVKMNEFQYRSFLSMYSYKMIFMNVLTDGIESYNFPTTYVEESELQKECERRYDELLSMEREIRSYPLIGKAREAFEELASFLHKKEGNLGFFNTFNIFISTWKDKML